MEATEILMSEHRVIERVISALETESDRLERGEEVRPGFFVDASDFITGFADGCHHRKEEGVLFATMEANGMPATGGPIGVMLMEHDQGRAYTRGMRQAALEMEAGDASARTEVLRNARGYAALLRAHIQKEDQILFPMADQVIPQYAHAEVLDGFEHVEHAETGEGVHERFIALAEALEREAAA